METGEEIESRFTGYAEDNNDKAIYKATTGANKYFYLKFFGIATEDDPEREDAMPAAKGGYARGGARPGAPATPRMSGPAARSEEEKPAPDTRKTQALINANKILSLQKQYGLSNEDVLSVGEIESIKGLAESGSVEKLADAYNKLSDFVRLQQAI